jgi:starch phosphorylase
MVPSSLARLEHLAWNLWWSWDAEATALFESIDPFRWARNRHNPIALFQDVEADRWLALTADKAFNERLDAVFQRFEAYLRDETWCGRELPSVSQRRIAYLSMEFGLHESVRQYSGGLGVLAGDLLRSASDLGIPLVGISLMWHEGYFRQLLEDGRQIAAYPPNDWDRLPIRQCLDAAGQLRVIEIPMGKETVLARIWRLDVGRTSLYLLDTDFEGNTPANRLITHQLYGGDHFVRLKQEIVLGLGAPRAFQALQIAIDGWHLNEGHSAFCMLELVARRMAQGETPQAALTRVRSRCVFTTHTPVPAGHDRFGWELIEEFLGPWRESLGLPQGFFMDLGRVRPGNVDEPLNMTVLALRNARASNGVSKLHGAVSRTMWADIWPGTPVEQVPIGHVTNGVHPFFFTAPETRALFDEWIPGWRDRVWDPEVWAAAEKIPDEVIFELRRRLRAKMVHAIGQRTGRHLDPDSLTFGFARRFAPYKRGDLLFAHARRLHDVMSGPRGGQIVFAGKAHPRDEPGQDILAAVVKWSETRDFRHRIVFVEDYDLEIGRMLTSGCDVWINTPRRPQEASGTSGQKAVLNGCLNLSISDGWWPEGYDGTNGWTIGRDESWPTQEQQDLEDAESLISTLETQVFPEWRSPDEQGMPRAWLKRIKRSIATCAPRFNSHRMARDYCVQMYAPICSDAQPVG